MPPVLRTCFQSANVTHLCVFIYILQKLHQPKFAQSKVISSNCKRKNIDHLASKIRIYSRVLGVKISLLSQKHVFEDTQSEKNFLSKFLYFKLQNTSLFLKFQIIGKNFSQRKNKVSASQYIKSEKKYRDKQWFQIIYII